MGANMLTVDDALSTLMRSLDNAGASLSTEHPNLAVIIALCITLLAAILGAKSLRSKPPPTHAQSIHKDIRIQRLFIHPIKSCRGSAVSEAHFDEGGLRYDRSFLIIDAQSRRFQTARELPRMVTIVPRMDLANNVLEVTIPLREQGRGSVVVKTPLDPSKEQLAAMELIEDITIWSQKADGYAVSREADEALSLFFGRPVRLVRKGPQLRNAGPDDPRGNRSVMHFQDFYPLLLASAASLQHVRDNLVASVYPSMASHPRMQLSDGDPAAVRSYKVSDKVSRDRWTPEELETLPMERFRPNIIVESFNDARGQDTAKALVPWEEDAWTHVEVFNGRDDAAAATQTISYGARAVGKGTSIDCVARCGRCMVPNVDPDEGTRDSFIPYTVMQKWRMTQPEYAKIGKPCFGVLASPAQPSGVLRVGDVVRVTSTMDPSKRVLGK